MIDFETMIGSLVGDGAVYRAAAREEWAQGRTLFGGMTAALAYAAIGRAFGDVGPLRSAQFAFVGPAAGALAFRPAMLRRGRSSTMVAVDAEADGAAALRSAFVFGRARESAVAHDRIPAPAVPAPDDCPPLHETRRPLPGFLARFEFRFAAGTQLFTPGAPAEFAAWVRFRDGAGGDPVAALLAVSDALPGAAMANFPKPAPLSTMSWGIDLHRAPDITDDWRLVHSSSEAADAGYSSQAMRTFDRAGRALASARQMVAIFA